MNIELSDSNKYEEYKKVCSIVNCREPVTIEECRQLIALLERFSIKYKNGQNTILPTSEMACMLYDRITELKKQTILDY